MSALTSCLPCYDARMSPLPAAGFAISISTVDSLSGKEPLRKPTTNVCNLGVLYPQYFQVVALADSGIKTVADMKGKRLTTQQLGNTGEFLTRELLSTAGLSYDDLSAVAHTSYSDSASQMKDGQADFFTLGSSLPTGSVMDLASARKIALIDVDEETFKYFKDQSAITPPVAMAVYAANALSQAKIVEASWAAVKLGATGFIVPFMFVYEPAILMQGDPMRVVIVVLQATIGVILLAAALQRYFFGALPAWLSSAAPMPGPTGATGCMGIT